MMPWSSTMLGAAAAIAREEIFCAIASCRKAASQAPKAPVLRQGAGAASAGETISATASAAAVGRKNPVLVIRPLYHRAAKEATMSPLRAIQIIGVAGVGAVVALAFLGNITDFGSNFAFVQHVLSMDTTFPGNTLRWRGVTSPALQQAAYWLIIATECVAGVLCLAGAGRLLLGVRASGDIYHAGKTVALWGLAATLALYLVGFLVIGGEWFAMWQSAQWNGQNAAFRMVTCSGLVTLILLHRD
jgi:predicted small integral membrane protein